MAKPRRREDPLDALCRMLYERGIWKAGDSVDMVAAVARELDKLDALRAALSELRADDRGRDDG